MKFQVVSTTFLGTYVVDKDLMFPAYMEEVVTPLLNHGFHTFNSILPILDMMLIKHKFPTFSFSVKFIIYFTIAYSIW